MLFLINGLLPGLEVAFQGPHIGICLKHDSYVSIVLYLIP